MLYIKGDRLTQAEGNDILTARLKYCFERDAYGVYYTLTLSLRIFIFPTMSTVFSLFVFDALGDAVEANNAYWSIFVVNSIPFFMWLISKYYNKYKIISSISKYSDEKSNIGVEMKDDFILNPINSIGD